jgi:hypothetical protein
MFGLIVYVEELLVAYHVCKIYKNTLFGYNVEKLRYRN